MITDEWYRPCDTSACVEVYRSSTSGLVFLRTTWGGSDNAMTVLEEEWDEFVALAKAGRFD